VLDDLASLVARFVDLSQIRRQLQGVDTASVVANNENRIPLVEAHVRELGSLHHLLLAEGLVLVLGEVEDVHLAVGGDGGEDGGGVRAPADVADGVAEVEGPARSELAGRAKRAQGNEVVGQCERASVVVGTSVGCRRERRL
jgi:hypothetical protein